MPSAKKSSKSKAGKSRVQVRDMKSNKDPKGGGARARGPLTLKKYLQ